MKKGAYFRLLKTEPWFLKRLEVLERDNGCCVRCGSKKNLHVHHTYYQAGKLPWQYPINAYETLCKDCHSKEHDVKDNTERTKRKTKAYIKSKEVAAQNKIAPGAPGFRLRINNKAFK